MGVCTYMCVCVCVSACVSLYVCGRVDPDYFSMGGTHRPPTAAGGLCEAWTLIQLPPPPVQHERCA